MSHNTSEPTPRASFLFGSDHETVKLGIYHEYHLLIRRRDLSVTESKKSKAKKKGKRKHG